MILRIFLFWLDVNLDVRRLVPSCIIFLCRDGKDDTIVFHGKGIKQRFDAVVEIGSLMMYDSLSISRETLRPMENENNVDMNWHSFRDCHL